MGSRRETQLQIARRGGRDGWLCKRPPFVPSQNQANLHSLKTDRLSTARQCRPVEDLECGMNSPL